MIFLRCTTALALTSLVLGCNDSPGTVKVQLQGKVAAGKPVARYGAQTITDAQLATAFAQLNPYTRARYQTLEQKREYLDGLIRYELLVQEAARRNLHNDPEVVESMKRVMAQRLIKTEVEGKPNPITPEEIQKYYDARRGDYVKPAMTRLRHVFVKSDNRPKADQLLKQALALSPLDYAAFSVLARENSEEPATQPIEGDLRFLTDDELGQQYGPQLVIAAAELKQVGEVYPKLVETKTGFHILKLEGRQVALNLSVDQVRQNIETTLANNGQSERYRAFIEGLKKSAELKVDEAALAAVVVDPRAPTVPSSTSGVFVPPPGVLEKANR